MIKCNLIIFSRPLFDESRTNSRFWELQIVSATYIQTFLWRGQNSSRIIFNQWYCERKSLSFWLVMTEYIVLTCYITLFVHVCLNSEYETVLISIYNITSLAHLVCQRHLTERFYVTTGNLAGARLLATSSGSIIGSNHYLLVNFVFINIVVIFCAESSFTSVNSKIL